MECLSDHFKFRKNAPMARQAFSAATPTVGEIINNFITRPQKLAEHCEYEGQRDNQVRNRAISFIKDRNLKSKLYREETLTLAKLMEIVSQYHDKEALILVRENTNNIVTSPKQGGKCWRCDKVGHFAKECVENVENLAILNFAVTQNSLSKIRDKHQVEVRVVIVEILVENFSTGKTKKTYKAQEM